MTRMKLIIFSVLGLLACVVVFLFVRAFQNRSSDEKPVTERDPMSEVQTEYTYKEMMAAQQGDFDLGDTAGAKRGAIEEETPDFSTPPTKNDGIGSQDVDVAAELREINRVRRNLDKPIPEEDSAYLKEDLLLQQYQAQKSAVKAPAAGAKPASVDFDPGGQAQFTPAPVRRKKSFNSLTSENPTAASPRRLIKAEIVSDVVVTSGYPVSIILLESTTVQGMVLPKNKVVTGVVSVQAPRISIVVAGTELHGGVVDASFVVCDLDGIEGLKVMDNMAGAESRRALEDEVTKAAEGVTGNSTVNGVIRIIKGQAGNGGVRGDAVKIPAGHKIRLKMVSNG